MVHHGAAANAVGEHVLSLGAFYLDSCCCDRGTELPFREKTKTPCPIEPLNTAQSTAHKPGIVIF